MNISFAMTTRQVRRQQKRVTRRMGWSRLPVGTILQPIVKGQGLKKGAHVETIGGPIRVISVRRERLDRLTADVEYGRAEMILEGFPDMEPDAFVRMFVGVNAGCNRRTVITRIEFEYVEDNHAGVRRPAVQHGGLVGAVAVQAGVSPDGRLGRGAAPHGGSVAAPAALAPAVPAAQRLALRPDRDEARRGRAQRRH